jgi:uncharacterized protein YbcI
VSLPEGTGLDERISGEIARIHEASWGSDALSIKTHVLDDLVVCVIDIGLLAYEQTLLENAGRDDLVRRVRQALQEAIGSSFVATVEHHTGRRVVGFLSDTHLEPHFSVEIFRLAPAATNESEPEIEP